VCPAVGPVGRSAILHPGKSAGVARVGPVRHEWRPCAPDPEAIDRLSRELSVSPFTATLLVNRGLERPEEAWRFLHPSLDDLHDPYLMKGMDRAVARISTALDRGEKILIYGDYDVDGITSTVVLRRALEMLGGKVSYHIPHRLEDGYGLRGEVLRQAFEDGCRLVISVDSGIRDFEVCGYARELGLDLVVTDHHLPDTRLPEAYAILNPRLPDCGYPDKDLAACGVVLKLVQALFERNGRGAAVLHFLKIVAIGTVADMVPLRGENRVLVRLGLTALAEPHNLGLQALLSGAGVGRRVDHVDISFKLAPRINAFTRMGGGKEIVDLFSTGSPAEAKAFVEEMNRKNLQRRAEEDRILAEVERRAEVESHRFDSSFLLVAGPNWHRGVIGNVAARVAQRFYRPTLAVSLSDGGGQGSGRGIPDFHLLRALDSCSEFFERYGGHAQAVGCTIKREYCDPEGVAALGRRLSEYADSILPAEALIPKVRIDSVLEVETLGLGLCGELERLAPFGIGNPVPTFASYGVTISGGPWILKERHLKLQTRVNGHALDVIWWRKARMAERLDPSRAVDLVYTLSRETYLGEDRLLLTVKDLRT
jgi:single-stranded-DNA-specific exonuclease